jgi:hypothetical protein
MELLLLLEPELLLRLVVAVGKSFDLGCLDLLCIQCNYRPYLIHHYKSLEAYHHTLHRKQGELWG